MGLLTKAKKLTATRQGHGAEAWHLRLRRVDPKAMKDIDDLIAAYWRDELHDSLPTTSDLARFIIKEIGLKVGTLAVRRYVNDRRPQ